MRAFLLCFFFLLAGGLAAQTYNAKIAPRLQAQLERFPTMPQEVLLLLEDREDMYALETALEGADLEARSRRVITQLRARAARTQPGLLRELAVAPGVQNARGYWIVNAVFAEMTPAAIFTFSRDARVALLDLNAPLETEALASATAPAGFLPDGSEAGLRAVNAPGLWALGYTGAGRIGMINDTGTDMEHPALASRYLGGYVNDTLSFFDQSDRSASTYDCGSHGTHVAGTMVGLDREHADTIGVAFNANWTAAAILCGIGTEDNFNSFQWALDPDGDSTTIADRPDVINNSWYDPSLDTTDCESYYVPLLQAVETAGIAVVFSAGNAGPDPMTITPPHNINTDIVNSFTVAAVNANSAALPIADFSSRGPSQCGGTGSLLIKPEVSAPGVNVRSCIPGNDYALFSGTSMAAPHVSGVILLLKEAFPYLTGRELKLALYYSAIDMGEPGEDNVFGNGMIDARAAYDYLVAQGHVPVPPVVVAHDLVLLEFSKEVRYCDRTVVAGTAKVYNNGTSAVTAFSLRYRTEAVDESIAWTGTLAPGETVAVALPELSDHAELGTMLLDLTVESADGLIDDLPRNNRIRRRIEILERPSPVITSTAEQGQLCTPGSALLTATSDDPAAAATFAWYADAASETPLATGASYVPAAVDSAATVYLGVEYTTALGLSAEQPDQAEMVDIDERGLRFETQVPIVLKSVKVYSETGGLRIIRVTSPFGGDAGTSTVNIPAGESRVTLNFDIPVGRFWSLQGANVGLPRKMSVTRDAGAFPYVIDDVVTITGNTEEDNENDYYFFYDWEISYDEPCGRKPVTLVVDDPLAAPLAAFSLVADTVQLDAAGEAAVSPLDNSSAEDLLWDFANGETATTANPTVVYTAPGTYRIRLRGTTDDCTSYAARDLVVLDQLTNTAALTRLDARVYPNPTAGALVVELPEAVRTEGRLLDAFGRTLRRFQLQQQRSELDFSGLVPGLYFIELRTAAGRFQDRIVIE